MTATAAVGATLAGLTQSDGREFCTFEVGGLFFGVDVAFVQEVLRYQEITPVPLAAPYVRGLINLRGQIVTAVDLRLRLGIDVAGGERFVHSGELRLRGHHHQPHRVEAVVGPQRPHQFDARHAGHVPVDEHRRGEVGRKAALDELEGVAAVLGFDGLEAQAQQHLLQAHAHRP